MCNITGITNAAEFLGVDASTIHRLIAAGDFPQPASEITLKTRKFRTWRETDLENYRAKLRRVGRPGNSGNSDGLSI